MSSLYDQGRAAPCPGPFNLTEYVLAAGQAVPDKTALMLVAPDGTERMSYAALRQAVLGTAAGLLEMGVAPGSNLLLRLGNTPDFPIVHLAAIAAGIIPVPTSSQLTEAEITPMAATIKPALIAAAPGVALPHGDAAVVWQDELRAMRKLPPAEIVTGDPDRPAYMVFTSGTSGQPRAVVHAHRAIWARRMMWPSWYGLRRDDRLLHAGAFSWTYTLGTGVLDPWSIGATALIPAEGTPSQDLPDLMKEYEATIFAAAPGVYRQMLRNRLPDLPNLRHGLSAGEKLPQGVREAWREATGLEIYEAYGMSECSTFISAAPDRPAPDGALGYPQAGRRVAILDGGAPVPFGKAGIISVDRHDPGLMLGYHGHAKDTAARYSGDWFLSGDVGTMRDDGAVFYLGRDDDMMNAGGYRVSPVEVESAMALHPAIRECAAVEYEVRQDVRVIALVYTGAKSQADALEAHAAAHLARYKQPRVFRHIDALPRGRNNKVLRQALRGWFARDDPRP